MKKALFILLYFFSASLPAETALHDVDINITQKQCIEKAKLSMMSMGATETDILDFENTISTRVGKYHYFVVCRADKGLAVVAEQGPQYTNRKSFVNIAVGALRATN